MTCLLNCNHPPERNCICDCHGTCQRDAYFLMLEIEKLPPSEQQTRVITMAGKLRDDIRQLENSRKESQKPSSVYEELAGIFGKDQLDGAIEAAKHPPVKDAAPLEPETPATRDAVKWLEDMGYGVDGKFDLNAQHTLQGYEIKEIMELFALNFPESGRTDPATPAPADTGAADE